MIQIVIGTEPAQYVPQQVLKYSIEKHASTKVDIRMPTMRHERKGGTNFGFVRFYTPSEFGYKGRAIYLDADQLVLADIKELEGKLDDKHAIGCVQNPEGWFGGKVVGSGNQTSVMIMDCGKLSSWNPDTMFDNVVGNRDPLKPGQLHYRDFMMLSFMDQSLVQPVDPAWNHFNVKRDDTKLTHFSHVRSQPWNSPEHELTEFWTEWMMEAMRAGYLTTEELRREIAAGNIHEHFRKCC